MRLHDGAPPENLSGVHISPEGSEQHLRTLRISLQKLLDGEAEIRRRTTEDPITTTQETLPGEQND